MSKEITYTYISKRGKLVTKQITFRTIKVFVWGIALVLVGTGFLLWSNHFHRSHILLLARENQQLKDRLIYWESIGKFDFHTDEEKRRLFLDHLATINRAHGASDQDNLKPKVAENLLKLPKKKPKKMPKDLAVENFKGNCSQGQCSVSFYVVNRAVHTNRAKQGYTLTFLEVMRDGKKEALLSNGSTLPIEDIDNSYTEGEYYSLRRLKIVNKKFRPSGNMEPSQEVTIIIYTQGGEVVNRQSFSVAPDE